MQSREAFLAEDKDGTAPNQQQKQESGGPGYRVLAFFKINYDQELVREKEKFVNDMT